MLARQRILEKGGGKIKRIIEKAGIEKRINPDAVVVPEFKDRGVLIVEDDPIERERAEKAMLKMGYVPFTVDNFAKASDALHKANFLFVLTDLHYPCCSGSDVAVPEQKQPQPNGIVLAVRIKMAGGKVAILTNQYHHGSVEWACNLCSSLKIPFLDTIPDYDTPEEEKGKKKWREAIERLKKI